MKAIVAAEQFKTSDYVEMLESVRAPGLKHRIKVSGAPHPDWLQFGDIAGLGGADDRRRVREISKSLDCRDPIPRSPDGQVTVGSSKERGRSRGYHIWRRPKPS